MPLETLGEQPVDKLVENYLHGEVSFKQAIDSIPESRPSWWSNLILSVILPADLFRRRLERMAWRQSRVLSSGSHGDSHPAR